MPEDNKPADAVIDASNEQPSIEDKAREMGWKPLEEFDGDHDKWVPAQSFVDRAPLFEKIDSQHKYIKNVEKRAAETERILKELTSHHKKVSENAYKKALADLKASKREALREGDLELADELDDRISELRPEPVPEVKEVQTTNPELDQWLADNPWYTSNMELQAIADGFGKAAIKRGLEPQEALKDMTRKMKELYPEINRNKNKDTAAPLESKDRSATSRQPSGWQPTEEQKRFAKSFAQSGVMTEKEYYKQLQELDKMEKANG